MGRMMMMEIGRMMVVVVALVRGRMRLVTGCWPCVVVLVSVRVRRRRWLLRRGCCRLSGGGDWFWLLGGWVAVGCPLSVGWLLREKGGEVCWVGGVAWPGNAGFRHCLHGRSSCLCRIRRHWTRTRGCLAADERLDDCAVWGLLARTAGRGRGGMSKET